MWVFLLWGLLLNTPILKQVIYGAGFGILSGLLSIRIIKMKFFKSEKNYYQNIIQHLGLDYFGIFFISFCAGFGEEVFFRGVLQQYFGVWLTAVLFVALHGYLNPKKWRRVVYGVFLVFVSGGFGYLYEWYGVWCAVTAHMVIDIILLYFSTKEQSKKILKNEI